jgi:O-antigen ligase
MAYFYIIGNRIWKKRIRFIALILISSLLLGVFLIPGSFYYLNQFFQYGASLPSFNARKSIWSELIDYQFQDIRTVLFGVGRTTYGIKTVVYDNEYVYLLVVHGLIFAIAFYVGGLWLVFKTMAKKRFPNFGEYILIGSFIYGIVAGIGLIVFFEPKFSFLALYLYLSYKGVVVKSDSYSNKNTFFRGKHE